LAMTRLLSARLDKGGVSWLGEGVYMMREKERERERGVYIK